MKKKNAISLIVLVITVIVMAILAATVIITLSNTNIISEENDAVEKTEAQQVEEMKAIMLADGMLGKNPEPVTIGDTQLSWDSINKKVVEKRLKPLVKEGVVIPDGFYYVGGIKASGLVISDDSADQNKGVDYTCIGNQFVWVPVEYTATGTKDANGLDTGFTAVFKRGTPEETSTGSGIYKMTGDIGGYAEPLAVENTGYDGEIEEYNAMMLSVQKNHGFYIARFEAGDGDVTVARTSSTDAHKVISKKNAYVYNYVKWGEWNNESPWNAIGTQGAVYLSQNMYKNSESVVSTLCYGVQWDATLNFVSDAEHNINDSRSWGNYSDLTGDISSTSNVNYTTGKSETWKAKNIYDLAGNVTEWTMEGQANSSRMVRGGPWSWFETGVPVSSRSVNSPSWTGDSLQNVGFRVTLYIK